MDKKSTPDLTNEERFDREFKALAEKIPPKYYQILTSLFSCYKTAALSFDEAVPVLLLFLQLIQEQFRSPYRFESYHQKVRHPIDYYQFGLDFIRPLVEQSRSTVLGTDSLHFILKSIQQKENVILLANHQTETDPQAIAILLEKIAPEIAASIIYVAGERVITDPLAIPFSMGCDLLCIYSKRYIDHPPEEKEEKILHNKKTMGLMSHLLEEGGKIIYVAPSGGRDRRSSRGVIEIAPFNPESIEMLYLIARKSKRLTHFVPLTLATYDLLPPPETVQCELGETRIAKRTPIHLVFAPPFDMEHFSETKIEGKKQRREERAKAIWSIVNANYHRLLKG